MLTDDQIRNLGNTLNLRETCEIIGIGESTGYAQMRNGVFPVEGRKVGRSWRFPTIRVLGLAGRTAPTDAPNADQAPDIDTVALFLADVCEARPSAHVRVRDMFAEYIMWCVAKSVVPILTRAAFEVDMLAHGVDTERWFDGGGPVRAFAGMAVVRPVE